MNLLKKLSIIGTTAIASLAIAQSASARYIVFVSGNDSATLQKVRTISPTAFPTKINNQPAVQAGSFNSDTSAENLTTTLNNSGLGLSAQKYFISSGGNGSNVQGLFTNPPVTSVPTLNNPQEVVIQQNPTVIPQAQFVQTGYTQPQTGFVPNSTPATSSDSYALQSGNFSAAQTFSNGLSPEQQLPQQTINPNFRYITAVPAKLSSQFLLSQVRQYAPNAFFANSGRGTYIHVGAYQNRDLAESASRYLRSQGIDSRVLYF